MVPQSFQIINPSVSHSFPVVYFFLLFNDLTDLMLCFRILYHHKGPRLSMCSAGRCSFNQTNKKKVYIMNCTTWFKKKPHKLWKPVRSQLCPESPGIFLIRCEPYSEEQLLPYWIAMHSNCSSAVIYLSDSGAALLYVHCSKTLHALYIQYLHVLPCMHEMANEHACVALFSTTDHPSWLNSQMNLCKKF